MPIEKGGRAPKTTSTAELSARILAVRYSSDEASRIGRPLPGKTSTSVDLALLLAARSDHRIRLIDMDPAPSAGVPEHMRQDYTPVIGDCPPSLGPRVSGPVWDGALRDLGLEGDGPNR